MWPNLPKGGFSACFKKFDLNYNDIFVHYTSNKEIIETEAFCIDHINYTFFQ